MTECSSWCHSCQDRLLTTRLIHITQSLLPSADYASSPLHYSFAVREAKSRKNAAAVNADQYVRFGQTDLIRSDWRPDRKNLG